MKTVEYWIKKLDLKPHPEGGYFREIYRSGEMIPQSALPPRFKGERCFSTCIYFLLDQSQVSAFHRIQQDELWHFYEGSSLSLHILTKEGNYHIEKLGRNIEKGEKLVIWVRGGDYFAAEVCDKNKFSLVGCTVAPGFDFSDFEMPEKEVLLKMFHEHKEVIERLGYCSKKNS